MICATKHTEVSNLSELQNITAVNRMSLARTMTQNEQQSGSTNCSGYEKHFRMPSNREATVELVNAKAVLM